jgi:ubiquinone/menaquinone biosynthesis C-methylase UbiE
MTPDSEYAGKYQSVERAERYDSRHFTSLKGRIFTSYERKRLKAAFALITKGGLVLDMPCGTGRITEQLLHAGFKVLGGDISESMLNVARRKLGHYPNLDGLKVMNGLAIPCPDKSLDGVTSIRFMCNIPHDVQKGILREFARVCTGPIIVGFSHDSPMMRLRNVVKKVTCPPKRVAPRISVLRPEWRRDEAEPIHRYADHRDLEGRRGGREDAGPGAEARGF